MSDGEREEWTNEGLATRLIQLEGGFMAISALSGRDMELEDDNALREAARRLRQDREGERERWKQVAEIEQSKHRNALERCKRLERALDTLIGQACVARQFLRQVPEAVDTGHTEDLDVALRRARRALNDGPCEQTERDEALDWALDTLHPGRPPGVSNDPDGTRMGDWEDWKDAYEIVRNRLRSACRPRRNVKFDTDAVSRLCHLAEVIESDPGTSDQYAEHIWEITEDMEREVARQPRATSPFE